MVETPGMSRSQNLPDVERISVLTGMITLVYVLTHFIDLPVQELNVQLPGIYLAVQININTWVGILVAGLTATAADWTFHDHPALKGSVLPYLILPALTAYVIGFPLHQVPLGVIWWIVLALGMMVLSIVLVGEYISIDAEDIRQPFAAAGLTAVSFALFLIMATSMRSEETRLFLVLPGVALGAVLVSLRVLHLRLHGQWLTYESLLIAFIISQFTAALYYWPVTPVAYGVLIMGTTYALTSLFTNLVEEKTLRQTIIEPVSALMLSIVIAIWVS